MSLLKIISDLFDPYKKMKVLEKLKDDRIAMLKALNKHKETMKQKEQEIKDLQARLDE